MDSQTVHYSTDDLSPSLSAVIEALQTCGEAKLYLLEVNRNRELVAETAWNYDRHEPDIKRPLSKFAGLGPIPSSGSEEPFEFEGPNDTVRIVLSGQVNSPTSLVGVIIPSSARGVTLSLIRQVVTAQGISARIEEAEERMADLMKANDSLIVQVTEDFEELTFIRSISEYLECTDATFDHLQMAAVMMEPLTRSVRAQYLAWVVSDEKGVLQLARYEGGAVLSEQETLSLMNQLRSSVEHRPFIQNSFQETELGARYPAIERILIVKMASSRKTLGYFVAINRTSIGLAQVEDRLKDQSLMEFGTSEASLLASAGSILAAHAHNLALLKQKEALLTSVIRAMVSAIEAKDQYTRGHSDRVALYGRVIAKQLGLSGSYQEKIYLSGLLHDVGKIGVSDATLRKPDKLTDEEFEEIKKHPDEGWAILHDIEQLRDILPGVLYHHERIDGRGYPDGLKGLDIPLDGRILAVADAYDAMTSDRPYRKGMPTEKAETILQGGAGTQWDSAIIEAFFEAIHEISRIANQYEMPNKPRRHPDVDRASLD